MEKGENNVDRTVRIPMSLYQRMVAYKKRTGCSMAAILTNGAELYLDTVEANRVRDGKETERAAAPSMA